MKNFLFKWVDGRQQGTEYKKMCLWSFKVLNYGFDCYILKYAANTRLDWHTDPVKNGEHWRKNITLKGSAVFCIEKDEGMDCGHKYPWFRPDIREHMLVTGSEPVTKLSLGFVKFTK